VLAGHVVSEVSVPVELVGAVTPIGVPRAVWLARDDGGRIVKLHTIGEKACGKN
jgi:hypothetical protein